MLTLMQPQNNLEWKLQKEILPTYSVKHNGLATERSLPYTQTVGTKAGTFRKQEKKNQRYNCIRSTV